MGNYKAVASIIVLQHLLLIFLLSTCKTIRLHIAALLKLLTTQPLQSAYDSMLVSVLCWITPVCCMLVRHFLALARAGCRVVMPTWMAYFLAYLCLTTSIKMPFWIRSKVGSEIEAELEAELGVKSCKITLKV
jgi:hypothetical protein